MKILAFIAVSLFVLVYFMTQSAIGGNGSVTLAWDTNTEPDLAGYKIYVGKTSRFATKVDVIGKWCESVRRNGLKSVKPKIRPVTPCFIATIRL